MRPTEIIVDLDAIRHNFNAFKNLNPASIPVPVVKSDAYGHGAIQVATALQAQGAQALAVFRVEEAIQLRNANVTVPIWVLLGALDYEIDDAVNYDLTLACWSLDNAGKLNDAAKKARIVQPIHLKIDTGMGRLGFLPNQVRDAIAEINSFSSLRLCGAFTHIAKADEPCHPVTANQVEQFRIIANDLPASCNQIHLAATSAIERRLMDALPYNRPGIGIYGIAPEKESNLDLIPAMTVKSRLISLKDIPKGHTISYNCTVTLQRDSKIAVVPIGYSTGLQRAFTNKMKGIVRGKIVNNLGTVCMDMTMFDLTDVPDAAQDDEIILLGKQGNAEITAWELASAANTIPYEILCNLGQAHPRTYLN